MDIAANVLKLNNNNFAASKFSSNGEFFLYNENNESWKWRNFIPDFDEEYEDLLKDKHVYEEYKRGIIKSKPDRSLFVKAYNFVPIIRIFDTNGELVRTIRRKNLERPRLNAEYFDDNHSMHYNNVYTTDNHIYALSYNCSVTDLSQRNCNNVEVHRFDWEGNALVKFKLNEGVGLLSPFVVDESNSKIYTISTVNENTVIKSYDF